MISREEANAKNATIDAPELLALLKNALHQFLRQAIGKGFQHPIDVALRDADGGTLREFTIERSGRLVAGRTDDPNQLFVLPLTVLAVDANGRIARMVIGASRAIEPTEFVN